MADFCKKCSIKLFGKDTGDLANLSTPTHTEQELYPIVLCESCGTIQVNHLGECVSPDCKECKNE